MINNVSGQSGYLAVTPIPETNRRPFEKMSNKEMMKTVQFKKMGFDSRS